MSKTRHRLLAIMALLLAMLTVMPSAMADMRGINVSGRAVSERHVHRRLRLRRRQGHAGHRLHQRVHDQPGQLRAAAGQEPRLLPLPGGGNATAEADYFVNTVRPYIGTAVLVLDWEGYQNAAWGTPTGCASSSTVSTRGPAYGRSSTRPPPTCTRSQPTCAATAAYGSRSTPTTTPPDTRRDRGTTGDTARPCASTPATAASPDTPAHWI